MATLTIYIDPVEYELVYGGYTINDLTDQAFVLYDTDGAEVSGLTVTITKTLNSENVSYRIAVAGISRSYRPGSGKFHFEDHADIRYVPISSIELTTLLNAAARGYSSGWFDTGDLEDLIESAGLTVPATADLNAALAGAVAEIERRTGRRFETITESRRFDGDRMDFVFLPRCSSITAVELVEPGGTVYHTLSADDYVSYPLNEDYTDRIKRVGYWWPRGEGSVRVTATWGETVPDDLRNAQLYLAALQIVDAARQSFTEGVTSWKIKENEVQYGQNTLSALTSAWQARVDNAIRGHREVWF